ncbi:MAG: hypothetical protein PHP59_11075 [Methanofollis sp.]|uniref:hypothetical protein n=1 Tax=Methanofollis sp. TaxID=2052835 RepID=UPI00263758C9|nr:hypothetical protein [Methanofollis sp.]MDD4255902.1 hypothetical protein [Methanofollis sp.]
MLYYAQGNAIVTRDELYEKVDSGELTEFYRDLSLKKSTRSIRFSTGDLTAENAVAPDIVPFQPIGMGKPLTIMIREVYTGRYPQKLLGDRSDMLVTSAVRSPFTYDARPRAMNYLAKGVSPKKRLFRPSASDEGTPVVFYSPALIERSLTLDLTIVFDDFPKAVFEKFGGLMSRAAAIPVFLPYSTYLFSAGVVTNLIGSAGEMAFDRSPEFSTSEPLDIRLPGSVPVPPGFALISDDNVDRYDETFLTEYHVDGRGRVVDMAGTPYAGNVPYIVVSLDGTPHDELSAFAPAAASAAVLSRFFGVADKQTESFEILTEGVKLYNDYAYRKQVDALDATIASLPAGEEKEALVKKREALAKNILTDLLKK